ncbi:hypothetical protein [Kitasatospora sp. NPDC093679]|uniref:hypothetical protein n=1 Tax=Kitasatospora sp. NPDC093679 TaxID=3154983 RepID=UPI003440AAFB
MRMLVQASIDTERSNAVVAAGKMPESVEQMLNILKPEAAYFYPLHGRRGFTMVVDVADEAALIPLVEPLWTEMGADVEVVPCLTAQELQTGLARLTAQS